ncbi:response regulator receiver domain protein [Catonella morbi ATCC 51271]|uniref:Stage 0 sporulation protein A homolog n=1 Tax=Catonella morbi ATCC 51271 TaxID=592026 RepID=V2Y8E3_9FIRM|nr:LytTR family DNA-binding domain-containing protein [Catonella morbi]ESL03946.1 response regulator receiver domain protein [Catonella morbi ATCC 51271]
MKIAVVDDNKTDFELFLKLIEAYGKKHQRTIYTQGFSGGEELLSEFQKGKFAAIFLDIYMGGINGVETAKAIRQKDDEVRLFFTTTSAEHLADGFAVEATHYLIKPLTEEKIEEAMHRLRFFFAKEDSIIVFPNGSKEISIPKSQILYIETIRNGIMIYCKKEAIPVRCSISEAMKRLKFSNFLRCHRYSSVNLEAVVRVEDDSFVMTDGKRIFMRREGRKELKEKYYHYFLDKVREECEW